MTTAEGRHAAVTSVTESDLSVALIDLATQEIVAASKSLLDLLELDQQELIGRRVSDFVAGRQTGALPLLAGGYLDGAEADRIVRDLTGDTFPVHAWAHVLGSVRPARYATLLILDRRDAATTPTEEVEDSVYGAVDAEWRIDHVSSGIQPLLGYEPDALAGTSLFALIHPEDLSTAMAGLAAIHATALGALACLQFRHADGHWQPCRMRFVPLTRGPGFGFLLRAQTDLAVVDETTANVDEVLQRLHDYLLAEQSMSSPAQLPTSSELSTLGQLSSTEWEVLLRLNTGAEPEDIGAALRRDPRTIRLHLASIFEKLGVSTRDELLSLLASASGGPDI
jgi:DNA-binding CsgD family transcriptional regulator